MPSLFTTLRRKVRRSFYGAAGVYVATGILLGSLFCFALAFHMAMRESFPPATATALTGLMLLLASIVVLLLTSILVKFSKRQETEALQVPDEEALQQTIKDFITGPDNPLVDYVHQNPTQAVLLAAAAGGLFGASPAARSAAGKIIQELVKKQTEDSNPLQ